MSDLISRKALIDVIEKEKSDNDAYCRMCIDSMKEIIEEQPTVEAKEVVHGKWIDTQPDYHNGFYRNAHVCSNCNDYYTTEYDDLFFCPRCGADMRTSAE